MTRFASVILDVDSTLVTIEGISWLAARRGAATRDRVAGVTDAAMRGDIRLDGVYAERMALVRPTRDDVQALGRAYIDSLQPGAAATVSALRQAGVRVALVSGGLRQAIAIVGARIGVNDEDICGVGVRWDEAGTYVGFDEASPLTRDGGKPIVAQMLGLPSPTLAVGDGMTDAELKAVTGHFVAFTGTVTRERAVAAADAVISRFPELLAYVMT